jgi:YgiT-type zinc finger domain-containing protein
VDNSNPKESQPVKCSIQGCLGQYAPRKITHTVRWRGDIVVIDHVPAEVCSVCGDTLLDPQTVRQIERMLSDLAAPTRRVPLYEFA